MINKRLFVPEFVRIADIRKESELVKSYRVKASERIKPGQFFQVSVLGVGEVPISVSSSPTDKGFIELTVRKTGRVTSAIHQFKKNDLLGLRGPYGNYFPIDELQQRDLIFVAGGIGLAPLRSLIRYVQARRRQYGHMYLFYGAKTQKELIFKPELKQWQCLKDFHVLLTVDKAEGKWNGNVGVVTSLLDKVDLECKNSIAFVCGPPIMIKYTLNKLLKLKLSAQHIFVTLERYMNCGVGKCGHCYLGDKYVCIDGPVFSYEQLSKMKIQEVLI